MIIRKQFKYEMGHIVRQAWSTRCSRNAHGHSYLVEFMFNGPGSDNGQMLMDFGFIKQFLHPFVDSFDHSFWLWDRPGDKHIIEFFNKEFERVLVSPWSTTAEMQAKMFYHFADDALRHLYMTDAFENGEQRVSIFGVKVHETTTGWAEYCGGVDEFPETYIKHLYISDGIKVEWPEKFKKFYENLYPQSGCVS
jgi:6-pyruvoyltetrahydropterin/6-carboxytetrahydropterin synthase